MLSKMAFYRIATQRGSYNTTDKKAFLRMAQCRSQQSDQRTRCSRSDPTLSGKIRRCGSGPDQATPRSPQGFAPGQFAPWVEARLREGFRFISSINAADMKVVSFIEDRRVVERILRHLDLLAEPSGDPPSDELVYDFYDELPVVEEEGVVYQPF